MAIQLPPPPKPTLDLNTLIQLGMRKKRERRQALAAQQELAFKQLKFIEDRAWKRTQAQLEAAHKDREYELDERKLKARQVSNNLAAGRIQQDILDRELAKNKFDFEQAQAEEDEEALELVQNGAVELIKVLGREGGFSQSQIDATVNYAKSVDDPDKVQDIINNLQNIRHSDQSYTSYTDAAGNVTWAHWDRVKQKIVTQTGTVDEAPAAVRQKILQERALQKFKDGLPLTEEEELIVDNYHRERSEKNSSLWRSVFVDPETGHSNLGVTYSQFNSKNNAWTHSTENIGLTDLGKTAAGSANWLAQDAWNTDQTLVSLQYNFDHYENLVKDRNFDPLSLAAKLELAVDSWGSLIKGMDAKDFDERMGRAGFSGSRKRTLHLARKFIMGLEQGFNKYRKFITGVQAGYAELQWLRRAFPNADDTPAEYLAKADGAIRAMRVQAAHAQLFAALNPGKEMWVKAGDGSDPYSHDVTGAYLHFLREYGLNDNFLKDDAQLNRAGNALVSSGRMTADEAEAFLTYLREEAYGEQSYGRYR